MKRLTALALVIALLAPAPGPAEAGRHIQDQSVDLMRAYAGKLPIGSTVKVRLKAGERVKGILMAVDTDTVVVKPKTRIPVPERLLPMGEIDTLELERNGGGVGKAVAIGVAAGAATFLSILLIAFATLGD